MGPRNKGLCPKAIVTVLHVTVACYSEVLQFNRHNEEEQSPYILPLSETERGGSLDWDFEPLNSRLVLFAGSCHGRLFMAF